MLADRAGDRSLERWSLFEDANPFQVSLERVAIDLCDDEVAEARAARRADQFVVSTATAQAHGGTPTPIVDSQSYPEILSQVRITVEVPSGGFRL